jgi:hypothetical protein
VPTTPSLDGRGCRGHGGQCTCSPLKLQQLYELKYLSIGVSDLTPNVGMWWYFVTEMFDHFRPFFLGVFHVCSKLYHNHTKSHGRLLNLQLNNVIYVAPLCLRLRHDPLLAMIIMTGIFGTWKSYPGLGDLGLWAGLLSCFPEVISSTSPHCFRITDRSRYTRSSPSALYLGCISLYAYPATPASFAMVIDWHWKRKFFLCGNNGTRAQFESRYC